MKKYYYTIGEVSNLLGVKPHVLRYWETEFPVLRPRKSEGRIRKFNEEHIRLLRKIYDLLYNQRFTIEGARQKMKQDRESIKSLHKEEQIELDFVATPSTAPNPELLSTLQVVRSELIKLQQMCKQYK